MSDNRNRVTKTPGARGMRAGRPTDYRSGEGSRSGGANRGENYQQGKRIRGENEFTDSAGFSRGENKHHEKGVATLDEKALAKKEKKEQRAMIRAEKDREWHRGIERVRSGFDRVFLILLILLISIGSIMVFTASYPEAISEGRNGAYYFFDHLQNVAFGAIVMVAIMFIPHSFIKKCSMLLYGFGAILLCLVLVMGVRDGEAVRWLDFGFIRFQPSEIAKFTLVAALAWYVSKYSHKFDETVLDKKQKFIWGVFVPSLFIFAYAGLVILEKHLSGTIILVAIGVIVLFLGGGNFWMMLSYYLPLGALACGAFLVINPYALARVKTFIFGGDALGSDWQTNQGLNAIGSGGFLGLGLGQSRQKFSYVSEAQNDFIFTIWCEEMGFVGALAVILLFAVFIWKGYDIALKAPDVYSSLLVFGIISQVAIQAILNIMVVTDMIPNTGVSLPFMSAGGTSLVMLMAQMGVVLSVSRRSYVKVR